MTLSSENDAVFKWVCLLVAIVALAGIGWMLNDVRLEFKHLADKADKLIEKTDKLTAKVDKLAETADKQVPQLLSETERVAKQLELHLPKLLKETETAAATINNNLPRLFANANTALDNLSDLSDSFNQYKEVLSVVHTATQNKGLFSYGSSILDWIDGQDATIGVKKAGSEPGLKQERPAKEWVASTRKEALFLSLRTTSKAEMLHGLARTSSRAPLYIQIGNKAPRLLADWLKETHSASKEVQ